MQKAFRLSIFSLAVLLAPAFVHAETLSGIFPFFSPEKPALTAPTPMTATTAEITGDNIDLNDLKNQPLPVRRKMVATELDTILLRLNSIYDKTKSATTRLTENGIDTKESQVELAKSALSLAQARLTIDSLIFSANDPLNEDVVDLMIGDVTFKDTVIKAETDLRASRESIINALIALKASVSAVTVPTE